MLSVDNIALKWLKTYLTTSDIMARWITILGAFKMRIEINILRRTDLVKRLNSMSRERSMIGIGRT